MPPTTDPADAPLDGVTYAAAVAELETLLAELERDDVDVDDLAAHVARAADLIRVCRDRIERAQVDVERVVAQLDIDL